MLILFYLLSTLVIFLTLITFSRSRHWVIRFSDFPRLQILITGISTLVLGLFTISSVSLLQALLFIALIVAVLYQALKIIPFTPFYPFESVSEKGTNSAAAEYLSVLIANVLMSNRCADQLIRQVKHYRPDVFLALETNDWWAESLSSLHEDYIYRVACPQDNLYGMHLYSRYKLTDYAIEYLVEKDVPSIHASLELDSGRIVRLFCVHPAPPSPTENTYSDERDLELIMVGYKVAKSKDAAIVFGDLNDVAWSRTTRQFKSLSSLKDPRIGRGMFSSFNAKYWPLRWPLDHLFHSSDFHLSKIERLEYFGSDHFPLYIELVLAEDENT